MNVSDDLRRDLARVLGETAGAVSTCWEHLSAAGVFDSVAAAAHVDRGLRELEALLAAAPDAGVTVRRMGDGNLSIVMNARTDCICPPGLEGTDLACLAHGSES